MNVNSYPGLSFADNNSSHYLNTLSMISELLENKTEIFSPDNIEAFNYKNILLNPKNFPNLLPPPMLQPPFNKSHMFPPFNMGLPNIRLNEKPPENEDYRYINQRNLTTPFKRAGTHVAIAYYIYVNKNKSKFNENKNTNECDPTYHARVLREKKNVEIYIKI